MNIGDLRTFESRDIWVKDGTILDTTVVKAPTHPPKGNKFGGPVYVSVGQIDNVEYKNSDGKTTPASLYHFSNDLVDFTYYKNPVVVKIEPASGLSSGGTPIEVSGMWFDNKPAYGIIPQCKIGDKIVRAHFHSTVRIVCTSPPNTEIYRPLPVSVSLNGVDWVDSGATYSYYI